LAALAPRPGERVLDIGCGGVRLRSTLSWQSRGGTVVGDRSVGAVLAFAQRAAQGGERVRFVQADAAVFPFEPASFDAAFSRFGVISSLTQPLRLSTFVVASGRTAIGLRLLASVGGEPLDILPLQAASAHLPPQPLTDSDAPGPIRVRYPTSVRAFWNERLRRQMSGRGLKR